MHHNPAFCIYPWIHLYGGTDGRWQLCCDQGGPFDLGSADQYTMSEVWNSQKMRDVRLKFLRGERISPCARCYRMETAGMTSPRTRANAFWQHHLWRAQDTKDDGTIDQPIVYIDIRFSNLCNFRCRMCSHHYSSAWYKEAVLLGEAGEAKVIDAWTSNKAFWHDLTDNVLPFVEEIYFAGGEPLMQDSHYRLLESLITMGRTDTRLNYNTNLSTLQFKGHDLRALWSHFEAVSLWPSIDGFGKRGEYIRKGLVWENWWKNAIAVREYIDSFSVAISIYNVQHYPDLYAVLTDEFPNAYLHGELVMGPAFLSIQILDKEMKQQVGERYERFLQETPGLTEFARNHMKGWLTFMSQADRSELATQFKKHTAFLDDLRHERFVDVFPELSDWYQRI